jgi:hypothetical protein
LTEVLIQTPVKDAAANLGRYSANLLALDRMGLSLSVGMLESDSIDDTFARAETGLRELGGIFDRTVLWRKSFGYRMPPGTPRWSHEHQADRRSVLASSRSHLLFRSLGDADWVLWLDVDVIAYPRDLIQRLLSVGQSIVHPHCVLDYGGPTFDRNAWHDPAETHMDRMRARPEVVPLDAVDGTCLLVSADLHRDGLIFPPFLYGRAHFASRHLGPWAPQQPGKIETDGLGLMAQDMGAQCWGLPRLEILHARALFHSAWKGLVGAAGFEPTTLSPPD